MRILMEIGIPVLICAIVVVVVSLSYFFGCRLKKRRPARGLNTETLETFLLINEPPLAEVCMARSKAWLFLLLLNFLQKWVVLS